MMLWGLDWMRQARIALVVVYGIVLPLLLISGTDAHKHFVGQTWAHSVGHEWQPGPHARLE
jgi:hypothetical protein